jgi:hypothetical protein
MVGTVMSKSAKSRSSVQSPSATSATIFSAGQHPDARDSATPYMPKATISSALRGNRIGMDRAANERSLAAGTVDDFAAGSSPT